MLMSSEVGGSVVVWVKDHRKRGFKKHETQTNFELLWFLQREAKSNQGKIKLKKNVLGSLLCERVDV